MKKYLLPKDGQFYKANLHCHTNLSDGDSSPEEIKKAYKEHGYQIVAFTDHDILIPHQYLNDDEFLALNGCEIEVNQNDDILWREMKTCHICCIALKPDNINQVCYHRSKYLIHNAQNQRDKLAVDESKPDFIRVYSHEGVSKMMKEARDNGFFVTYNHPDGSLEYYPDYIGYKGMHALEIYNTGDALAGYPGYYPYVYDDLLRAGNKIYCIAGDDGHSLDWPFYEDIETYTMIKAKNLEYCSVTDALVNGDFYVTRGPVIDELWFEDGELHVKTPGVKKIIFTIGNRRENKVCINRETGEPVTEASYKVKPDQSYIRVTLYDEYGKTATTNAFFVEDLLKGEENDG